MTNEAIETKGTSAHATFEALDSRIVLVSQRRLYKISKQDSQEESSDDK
jgi:hypothetical protein